MRILSRGLAITAALLTTVLTSRLREPAVRGIARTPPGLGRLPYTDADVDFMAGMIPHHAQAVVMAGWAPSHGARKDVAILCERIVVGAARRDRDDAELAARSRPDRARCDVDAPPDEDERHGARHADAGHVDRRRDGRARQGARAGVRSPVPDRHDQAPSGRDRHGRRAVQGRTARRRTRWCSSSRPTSTPINRSRSIACSRCWRIHSHDLTSSRRRSLSSAACSLSCWPPRAGRAACATSSSRVRRRRRRARLRHRRAGTAAAAAPPSTPAAAPAPLPRRRQQRLPPRARRGARRAGGRGTPPPPPPPPPAVMPKPVSRLCRRPRRRRTRGSV